MLSLGAYEEARIVGPNGEDYGTDRAVIVSLDFALDGPDGGRRDPWTIRRARRRGWPPPHWAQEWSAR